MKNYSELFRGVEKNHGVYILSNASGDFEQTYLSLRKKEGWLQDDDVVATLPDVPEKNPNYRQWMMRLDSADRFTGYIYDKKVPVKVLELGCGNGWFSNAIAQCENATMVVGVDINLTELKQAARVFTGEKLLWAYANIFESDFLPGYFDMVVLNAGFQYFPDTTILINRLLKFLKPGGEIHIIDTPFYTTDEVAGAKSRSASYFAGMQSEAMQAYYHHHSLDELKPFDVKVMHRPSAFTNRVKSFFGNYASPFPWLLIKKPSA